MLIGEIEMMKNIKLLVMLALVFALALTAVACGSEPASPANTTETTAALTQPATQTTTATTTAVTTTAAETTAETTEAKVFSSLKIGETPISEYIIVYAGTEFSSYTKIPNMKPYFPVCDFNRETAERLSDMIFSLTGVRLKAVGDTKSVATANEILIGNTNRTDAVKPLMLNNLSSDDYVIDVEGTKLVICGGEYGTTWHALDYLETFFAGLLAEHKTDYAFASDFSYKGNYHLVRIGCIGDSITQGNNISPTVLTYPAHLARYLWKDALVTNLGSSGSTMRDDLAAYTERDVYQTALKIAPETDLFIIMLGTNDSFYDGSWTSDDSEKFNADCLDIVNSLWTKNKNLQFVLANCPKYFGTGGWASATVRLLQKALVPTLNEAGYPTTFFDMYTATSDMGNYFTDQLHPNKEGYMMMGEIYAKALAPIIESMKK